MKPTTIRQHSTVATQTRAPPVFAQVGETTELRAKWAYVGEINDLEGGLGASKRKGWKQKSARAIIRHYLNL